MDCEIQLVLPYNEHFFKQRDSYNDECYKEKVAKFRYSEGQEIVTHVFKLVSFRFNHNVIFLPENPRGDFSKTW